ncbi:unnamed protein product [Linum trigynum]|uniref:Uncharacterized protein n=1 Tax=Linum trigynum TaxID=586398 RepID=A0AAV2E4T4_9ROSI
MINVQPRIVDEQMVTFTVGRRIDSTWYMTKLQKRKTQTSKIPMEKVKQKVPQKEKHINVQKPTMSDKSSESNKVATEHHTSPTSGHKVTDDGNMGSNGRGGQWFKDGIEHANYVENVNSGVKHGNGRMP